MQKKVEECHLQQEIQVVVIVEIIPRVVVKVLQEKLERIKIIQKSFINKMFSVKFLFRNLFRQLFQHSALGFDIG